MILSNRKVILSEKKTEFDERQLRSSAVALTLLICDNGFAETEMLRSYSSGKKLHKSMLR